MTLSGNERGFCVMTPPAPESDALWQQASRSLISGNHAAALATARAAAERFPEHPAFREIIAECAIAQGDDVLAEDALRQWIALRPRSIRALNHLGILYDRQQREAEALRVYQTAREIAPEDPSVLTNLGILHEHRKEYVLAESLQRQALALSPRSAQIAVNLAALLGRLGRFGEAERHYQLAIAAQPDFAVAHANLGMLYADMNRFAEAETALRRALAFDPAYVPAHTGLASVLLAQGRYAEGWECLEKRRTVGFFQHWFAADPVRSACRYWQGEALEGKSILIFPEQGFGDEIQFARYLRLLRERGAAHITQICYPEQKGIMQSLQGPDLVLSLPEAAQHRKVYDYWSLLMSLPCQLHTEVGSIPADIPYLTADPSRIKQWATRMPAHGKRVGILWRGNPQHTNDADRSLPGIEVLEALWALDGIRFIDLDRSVSGEADGTLVSQPRLVLGNELQDFSDTAAVLGQLDLLISVDTAAVHLAGALGVPCWVLLPAFRTDWRWLRGREDSPWYPGIRLFRQEMRGDWQRPVGHVRECLQNMSEEGWRQRGETPLSGRVC